MTHTWFMAKELGSGGKLPEISEDDLLRAQGTMRYQTLSRYERMYQVVEARMTDDMNGDRPLDPRFLELGIRILKEESMLYRLARPAPLQEEEEDPAVLAVDRHRTVLDQLEALEARAKATADGSKDQGAGSNGAGSKDQDPGSVSGDQ